MVNTVKILTRDVGWHLCGSYNPGGAGHSVGEKMRRRTECMAALYQTMDKKSYQQSTKTHWRRCREMTKKDSRRCGKSTNTMSLQGGERKGNPYQILLIQRPLRVQPVVQMLCSGPPQLLGCQSWNLIQQSQRWEVLFRAAAIQAQAHKATLVKVLQL